MGKATPISLSPLEQKVLDGYLNGETNAEIAAEIGPAEIEMMINQIRKKQELPDRCKVVLAALEQTVLWLYSDGLPPAEIATLLYHSPKRIHDILAHIRAKERKKTPGFLPRSSYLNPREDKVTRLRREDLTHEEIAKRLHLTIPQVSHIFRRIRTPQGP